MSAVTQAGRWEGACRSDPLAQQTSDWLPLKKFRFAWKAAVQ
jgi:hypothetical protein